MNREKFEAAWMSSTNVTEAAGKLGITETSAYYWAKKFGLPTFRTFAEEPEDLSPTPEEIAERAAEVRKMWSPEEEQRRVVGGTRRRYEIPSYAGTFR